MHRHHYLGRDFHTFTGRHISKMLADITLILVSFCLANDSLHGTVTFGTVWHSGSWLHLEKKTCQLLYIWELAGSSRSLHMPAWSVNGHDTHIERCPSLPPSLPPSHAIRQATHDSGVDFSGLGLTSLPYTVEGQRVHKVFLSPHLNWNASIQE